MMRWRKRGAVLPKRNGVWRSSAAAGVPMTMWEAVSFQFSRKLRTKKLLFVREDTHRRQSSVPCTHKMSIQLSLSWLKTIGILGCIQHQIGAYYLQFILSCDILFLSPPSLKPLPSFILWLIYLLECKVIYAEIFGWYLMYYEISCVRFSWRWYCVYRFQNKGDWLNPNTSGGGEK